MAATISGSVMNGPTPIMSTMFSVVAGKSVSPRTSCGRSPAALGGFAAIELASHQQPDNGSRHQVGHGAGDHGAEAELGQLLAFVRRQRADAADLDADG